jgi:hypothetical protein
MCQSFLTKQQEIDAAVQEAMSILTNTNSDILTKGKQTFDPIEETSTTASRAYKKLYDIIKKNFGEPSSSNTLKRHLLLKQKTTDTYDKSGVYKLKCADCPLQYIGQMGRTFKVRFKEHIRDIRNNKSTSGHVQRILDTGHACGKMNEIMDIVKVQEKGKHLNTSEKYHLYKLCKQGIQLSNNCPESQNPVFQEIYGISQ